MFQPAHIENAWNGSDGQPQGIAGLDHLLADPGIWNDLSGLSVPDSRALNQFPSSDSLLNGMDSPINCENLNINIEAPHQNLLETALQAPALLMESWKELSGIGMAEDMVKSVLQNPEAMKLAAMAIQVGMFAA